MSNTSKFILRTIRRHITVLGLSYLILWISVSFIDFPNLGDPQIVRKHISVIFSLFAGAIYLFSVLRIRPLSKNPIQQFMLNLFIFIYSFMAILPLTVTIGLEIQLGEMSEQLGGAWITHAIVYLFFALFFISDKDVVAQVSANGRKTKHWDLVIRQHRRRNS